ncbi:hypothetical protein [Streptomyces sp. NPDC059371]|uniref:hypothetical protein n=1 Tax=Streptomyces sp. NPDC059371 TaxID=3346812 RepID=UPI00369A436E
MRNWRTWPSTSSGPTVPFGGRRTSYGWEPDHAVVLALPRFAARHAAEHIREHRGRITAGPELTPRADGPAEHDVLTLLRGAYPYVPADAGSDGADPRPTALVVKARTGRRAARQRTRSGRGGPESIERYNELVAGTYVWVPDDDHSGFAAAELTGLPIHWLKDWTLWVDIECGRRPDTALHRLYGTVVSFDPGAGIVGFCPVGGHPAIALPVHRIVALSGAPQRRGSGDVPAHEPVDEC